MAAETGLATIRDPGEAGGPSLSPLHTASATVGAGLGTHGGGRAGSARGDVSSCLLPWGPLLAPVAARSPTADHSSSANDDQMG